MPIVALFVLELVMDPLLGPSRVSFLGRSHGQIVGSGRMDRGQRKETLQVLSRTGRASRFSFPDHEEFELITASSAGVFINWHGSAPY